MGIHDGCFYAVREADFPKPLGCWLRKAKPLLPKLALVWCCRHHHHNCNNTI
jgi:hypothetical protein